MTRLKDVATVLMGQSPPSEECNIEGNGKPFLQGCAEFGVVHPTSRQYCPTAAKICRAGDLLVSVRAPVGRLNLADQEYAIGRGLCAVTAVAIEPNYLAYTLSSHIPALQSIAVGSTYDAVTAVDVGALALPVAPRSLQTRIASFLDAETARIDELIAEQLGTRRLLDERVWSLFIDRLLALQPAKVPLRHLLRRLSDGPFGSAFTSADYCDEGAAVVRLGNIGFAEYRASDQAFIPMELYAQFLRHEVQAGDLLIAGLGDTRNHAGRACVSPDLGPAIVKGKCFVASVEPGRASASFLALYLSSALGRNAVGEAARGSTRTMINLEIAKSSLVLLPSFTAQEQIAEEVTEARTAMKDLIQEINLQIALLREHRQALITAAVSGGLDALHEVP